MTGANTEAGALVWVLCRNGCWWPGRILGTDELPENYVIPPRSFGTPIKLLGRPDGSIDWYNIEKPEHVKPFRCREFDVCIENAKVQRRLQREACNKGKYVLRNDAIMHALEIEMSRFPNEEPTNQTTEYSKEDISPIQDRRKNKMGTIRFVTPISKENHKRDNSSMPLLDEGAMKCQVLESDAVGLDARVEGSVFKPTELKNNIKVCDVEMEAYGNYKGHGLPLAFLISKSTGKPIKGYPVAVEVLEDSCPAPTTEVNGSAISCFDCLMESGISVPRQARSLRKPSGSRKISEHDLGKSWGPDARSFSSYSNSPRKNLTERSNRKAVVAEASRHRLNRLANQHLHQGKCRAYHTFQIVGESVQTVAL